MRKLVPFRSACQGRQSPVARAIAVGSFSTTAPTWMNMGKYGQAKWNHEFQNAPKVHEYDFNKEEWAKQMKFASMDTIIEPEIGVASTYSFAGLKRRFKQWLTMRKILERRPTFTVEELKPLYIRYKTLCHSRNPEEIRQLQRLTTHSECDRIEKLQKKEQNKAFTEKSWKALKLGETSPYSIELADFVLQNCYLGNLTREDWVQLTVRVTANEVHAKGAEPTKLVEYPVFELCLGDGTPGSALARSFIIVAVMNQDGVRYGKDSQNSNDLRKNIAKANRNWF